MWIYTYTYLQNSITSPRREEEGEEEEAPVEE